MRAVQGQQLVEAIHQVVRGARRGLFLVSPYFDPWEELGEFIEDAIARGVQVMIVVRDGQDDALAMAREFVGARVHSVRALHAKLYASESQGLVTSMNLLVSSANTAKEIGQLYDAFSHAPQYREIIAQTEAILPRLRLSDVLAGNHSQSFPRRVVRRARSGHRSLTRPGHCIRCGTTIRSTPSVLSAATMPDPGFDIRTPTILNSTVTVVARKRRRRWRSLAATTAGARCESDRRGDRRDQRDAH